MSEKTELPARTVTDIQWYAELPRSARRPTLFGISVIVFILSGFGVWGNSAPIAGAIVASGVFVATGQNKIIQHLEGGVIEKIAVREGDVVEAGQLLVHLDETAPRAELSRLVLRHARLMAMEARLRTEAEEGGAIAFPDEILAKRTNPDVAAIIDSQQLTFKARKRNAETEIAAIRDGIKGLQERVEGTKAQIAAVRQQMVLLEEEIESKKNLLKKGLVRKPEVLALQRAHANLRGELGRLRGEVGDAKERIARSEEQVSGVRAAAIKTAVEQLHETLAELTDVRERIRAAQGVLNRVNIAAPVKGVVVKLRYHTSGGVIEAGKSIMEILPSGDELIIEVRVRPQDIDNVKRGQHAMVRLTALNRRVTPMVAGEVVYVSADALPNEKAGGQQNASDIYVARVKLDPMVASAVKGFRPTPGMPAEVFIKTSERTFLEYIAQPLRDSMARAFREP